MPAPYLTTTLMFVMVALLAALDGAMVRFGLAQPFAALRWMRAHFITLGILSQVLFGVLPGLIAGLAKKPRPAVRYDIWLALNGGFIALVAGFAGINQAMILVGGVLVFAAVLMLGLQLWQLGGGAAPASLKFYLTGAAYLLLGIIIGTGLWLNWSPALRIQVPLEAHIHANSWGFMSLMFAGLLIDFLPMVTGKPLGSPRDLAVIYWGMTLGALGLVIGPWLGGSLPPTAAGLILHLVGTLWLVVLMLRGLRSSGKLTTPGGLHLAFSYVWILAPVLVAPVILLKFIKGAPVESTAPQALIYGWMLQFAIALVPVIVRRLALKVESPQLGGCKGSLLASNLGSILVWVSIFVEPASAALYGAGFLLYAFALVHPLKDLIAIAREKFQPIEAA